MINQHILKLSGSVEISEAEAKKYQFQKDTTITIKGEIRAIIDVPNDDGTINKIFRIRAAEFII